MNLIETKKPEPSRVSEFKLPTGVLSSAISEDEKKVACGCFDGVYLLDLGSGESVKLYAHESYVSSVEWISDQIIISAGFDGQLIWYDVTDKREIRKQKAHDFWSWDLAISSDRKRIASVTGQYLAGGYRYEPAGEKEPSLRIFDAESGNALHALPHVPSVQAVAISPDGKRVAAGNLMGEVRVFDLLTGRLIRQWTTEGFTSWGIIKSHSYLGGIFSMRFTPDGRSLLLAGMGPMRDPMAGNGRQLWEKWSVDSEEPSLLDQTHEGESGEGLMEALAVDSSLPFFVMGGRLRGGDWNAAFFDMVTGDRLAIMKTGFRITDMQFFSEGRSLLVVGATGQGKPKEGSTFKSFGRLEVYDQIRGNSA